MAANVARNFYKVYVGNLPWTVGHNELKKYFSKFGYINSASVVFDRKTGLSKNYGFVTFTNREALEQATIQTAHKLEGNLLKLQISNNS